MKRFFFPTIALACLGGVIAFLMTLSRGPELLYLVPEDSAAVITWHNPGRAWQRFSATKLGRNMLTTGLHALLGTLAGRDIRSFRSAKGGTDIRQVIGRRLFHDMFAGQTVFAVVPGEKSGKDSGSPVPGRMLFLCKCNGRRLVKKIRKTFGRTRQDRPLPSLSYQGYSIFSFYVRDFGPLFMTSYRDILMVTSDTATMHRSLDLLLAGMVGRAETILKNREFVRLRRQAGKQVDFFCYLNPADLGRAISSGQVDTKNFKNRAGQFLVHLGGLGLRRVTFFHQQGWKTQQLSLIVDFDNALLPPLPRLLAARSPVVDPSLKRVTAGLQLYLHSNWLDLPAWWGMIEKNGDIHARLRAERLDSAMQRYAGMDMERFLHLFGHKFTLLIKDFKTPSFFPVPRLCLQVALTDKKTVADLLAHFVAELPHKRETVAGIEVVSIAAGGGLMHPSYALPGNDLLLADGRDLVDDLLQPGNLLLQDPDFARVAFAVDQPVNLVFFARISLIARNLRQLAEWLSAPAALHEHQAGAGRRIFVDQVILPVLDGLTRLKTVFINARTTKGELVIQAKVAAAPQPVK